MGIVSALVLLTGFGLIVFLAFYNDYNRLFRKHKPEYFGLEHFHQITHWQTSEWQYRATRKGITLVEWRRLCDQQLDWIDAALKS